MAARVRAHPLSPDLYVVSMETGDERVASLNLSPGISVYGEKLITYEEKEFRIWDPFRSKLAAAVLNGIKGFPITSGSRVLYLGSASGTTASHVSDIVGEDGFVYCVDFAPRSMRDFLTNVSQYRSNVCPILGDARFPESYAFLMGDVDGIYCDVAQPEQARLLSDNAKTFLPSRGWALQAIKARSIDVTKAPSVIFEKEISLLRRNGFKVIDSVRLDPYDKAHTMVLCKYEGPLFQNPSKP